MDYLFAYLDENKNCVIDKIEFINQYAKIMGLDGSKTVDKSDIDIKSDRLDIEYLFTKCGESRDGSYLWGQHSSNFRNQLMDFSKDTFVKNS